MRVFFFLIVLMWTVFKVFTEFVTTKTLLLFYVLFFFLATRHVGS